MNYCIYYIIICHFDKKTHCHIATNGKPDKYLPAMQFNREVDAFSFISENNLEIDCQCTVKKIERRFG